MPGKVRPNLLSLFKSYLTRKTKEEEEKWERYARSRRNCLIYDDYGEFEITLGDCARTNREIRKGHNIFKMWVSGEFTNYDKK